MTSAAPAPSPRTGRVLGWALGTVLVAVLVGVVVGLVVDLLVGALSSDVATDGWGDLVAVVLGVLAGAATAVLVWVIGLVVGARRYFPRGSRLVAVVLALGVAVVGSVVLIALLDVVGLGGGAVTGSENSLLAIVVAVTASAAVFPWWERRLTRRA